MTASKIEWTDRSDWNPVRGCTRVSEGCRNCYAEIMAARFSKPGQWGHGFAHIVDTPQGRDHRWTGKVALDEKRLTLPLRWRNLARVFASSTSDISHESLPDEAIDRIFAVMALCPHLTFQVPTKRAARMRSYLNDKATPRRIARAIVDMLIAKVIKFEQQTWPVISEGDLDEPSDILIRWPLPNVWLGVSIEDQTRADERIPDLLATPAAVRFLSCEPLLGPVDLTQVGPGQRLRGAVSFEHVIHALQGGVWDRLLRVADEDGPRIDWVIAGGESGPGARPMHPDWARSLRDQCKAAGVAFHFKQWGEWAPSAANTGSGDGLMARLGKKRAGRLLDGVEHSEFPA